MSRSWEEVKSVLDDPYVPADTKEALLVSYVAENGDDSSDEVGDYTDGTKANYNLDGDLFPGMYQSTDQLYQQAQDERDEAGYSAQLTDEDVENGRTEIDGMQPPVEGSTTTGVQKSDEIFEAARPSLRVFEDFLPINDKVPGDSLGRYGKLNFDTDIKQRFDEQLGISFQKFLDDAKRLRDAHTELSDLDTSTQTQLNTLYREWTGPAANASYQYYSEKLTPNVTDLLEYLQAAPDLIDTTVTNIFDACKAKANEVIELYQNVRGTVGSATPHIAEQVVKLANGDFSSQDDVLEVAAWVDASTGSNLESTLRADDCGLNDENKEYTIRECKKWIRDSFNTDLHDNLYVNFKQACDDALELVNTHYETLNNYLKEYENKFGESKPPAFQQPPPGGNGDGGNGNGNGGDTGGGGGGTGTGGGGGGTGTGGGGGGMPEVPTPPATDPAKDPTTPPGTTDPSGENTPGEETKPDQTNPQTPGQDQEETVTIKDGDHEIAVTSPDGQGMVKVTVDDGSGQPKTYTLDFGAADPTTGAGTPGQSGTPGQPGTGGQPGTPGTPGQPIAQGEYGPNGAPPTAPGPDAPIEPGPDGKCVITDGELTITAERPEGQPDTVVVTVDDGTGDPTTYNLDYSEANTQPATDQPQGVTGAPYQVSGDLAEPPIAYEEQAGVSTQPAPGEMPAQLQADQVGTQPAYGEMPAQLQSDQVGTQPTPGEMPAQLQADQVSTQPAYGEMPAQLQSDQVSTQPAYGEPPSQQPAFATTAAAFNEPSPDGGPGQAGSFGAPDHSPSPYMSHSPGEASLPSAPDAPDAPADPSGGQQAHPGMAGGMPMMGGAGGAQGGVDSERAATQWRTTGDLFDEPIDPQRMRGAFGGEGN